MAAGLWRGFFDWFSRPQIGREIEYVTFTGTQPMPAKKQPKDMTKSELLKELADAQKTVAAQVVRFTNVEEGAARDFNKWQGEKEAAAQYQRALQYDVKQATARAESAEQRAGMYRREWEAAKRGNEQQAREIENLRRTGRSGPRDVFSNTDRVFFIGGPMAGKTTEALPAQNASLIERTAQATKQIDTLLRENAALKTSIETERRQAEQARKRAKYENDAVRSLVASKLIESQADYGLDISNREKVHLTLRFDGPRP